MGKISSIKERILQFIEYKEITKAEFFKNTDIPYSNFTGKSLESEIGGNMLAKICAYYREISTLWLLTGEGEMLIKDLKPYTEEEIIERKEPLTRDKHSDREESRLISALEQTIKTQQDLIDALREQIQLLKESRNK